MKTSWPQEVEGGKSRYNTGNNGTKQIFPTMTLPTNLYQRKKTSPVKKNLIEKGGKGEGMVYRLVNLHVKMWTSGN